MIGNLGIFCHISHMSNPVVVGLPDGNVKHVTLGGIVKLNPDMSYKMCFCEPDFKHNLLLVSSRRKKMGWSLLAVLSSFARHGSQSKCLNTTILVKATSTTSKDRSFTCSS